MYAPTSKSKKHSWDNDSTTTDNQLAAKYRRTDEKGNRDAHIVVTYYGRSKNILSGEEIVLDADRNTDDESSEYEHEEIEGFTDVGAGDELGSLDDLFGPSSDTEDEINGDETGEVDIPSHLPTPRISPNLSSHSPSPSTIKPSPESDSDSDTSSDSDSNSDSNSDISETESELAALEAADKKKYITWERGGFGYFRGPDGKFPAFLDQSKKFTLSVDKWLDKMPLAEVEESHETVDECSSKTDDTPPVSPPRPPTPKPPTPKPAQPKQKKRRIHGAKVSADELTNMLAKIPSLDDPCFRQPIGKVYLPRHASYTYLVHDLEQNGYTRFQTLWLLGAEPAPMVPNILWMRLQRFKEAKGLKD